MCKNDIEFLKWAVTRLIVFTMALYFTADANWGAGISGQEKLPKQVLTSTNRPIRHRQNLVLTIGQTEGDLQGKDDKVIQAGIEYLNRLGGGTLRVLPGVYNLRNAIYLQPDITLQGSGEKTILRKADSVVAALARDSDWFEYGVQVSSVQGFVPGGGIMLRSKTGEGDWQYDVLRATVTAIHGDIVFLDRLTKENFWMEKAINNSDLGFHPGSGSQRPIFRNCVSEGNSLGIFFCWSVSDGLVEDCILSENARYGISIGHRDTDNVIRGCTIKHNGEAGILFRNEANQFRSGNRNQIENCTIADNGTKKPGIGIDIQGKTQDITIRNTRIANTTGTNQKIGIRIGKEAGRVVLQSNAFENCPVQVEDLRS